MILNKILFKAFWLSRECWNINNLGNKYQVREGKQKIEILADVFLLVCERISRILPFLIRKIINLYLFFMFFWVLTILFLLIRFFF